MTASAIPVNASLAARLGTQPDAGSNARYYLRGYATHRITKLRQFHFLCRIRRLFVVKASQMTDFWTISIQEQSKRIVDRADAEVLDTSIPAAPTHFFVTFVPFLNKIRELLKRFSCRFVAALRCLFE